MTIEPFRTAMLNVLRIGPYDAPHRTNAPTNEWLIATLGGPENKYLTISDTSATVGQATDRAPTELSEQNSIVAVLAEDDGGTLQFLMVRHLPDGLSVQGRFFPADGAASLSRQEDVLQLRAFGRHAHSRGTLGDQGILHDIPDPAPNAEGAINWHFSAEERPWTPKN